MSVVVAFSPSQQGRAALVAGVEQARSRNVDLVVACHAYSGGEANAEGLGDADLATELQHLGVAQPWPPVIVRSSDDPDVGEFLVRTAEEEKADLVVIALRGKSRTGKLNLGAAARRVIVGCPCPVLAVKDLPAA